MAVHLPDTLKSDEIRILQEFRRLARREMTADQIRALKHPVGGGDPAIRGLHEKGYLTPGEGESWTLTPKSDELLALEHLPYSERG